MRSSSREQMIRASVLIFAGNEWELKDSDVDLQSDWQTLWYCAQSQGWDTNSKLFPLKCVTVTYRRAEMTNITIKDIISPHLMVNLWFTLSSRKLDDGSKSSNKNLCDFLPFIVTLYLTKKFISQIHLHKTALNVLFHLSLVSLLQWSVISSQVKSSFIVILLHVWTYSGMKCCVSQDNSATY